MAEEGESVRALLEVVAWMASRLPQEDGSAVGWVVREGGGEG